MTLSSLRRFRNPFRLLRDASLVSGSGIFDRKWYLAQNPDVAMAGVSPLLHYLRRGAFEGRDPGPYFDSDWYLARNADVAAAGVNPLVHYLRRGGLEGRDPSSNFDSDQYLAENLEAARSGLNPLVQYVKNLGKSTDGHNGNEIAVGVDEILRERFAVLQPIRIYSVPNLGRRITIVTDSINQGSLFGGVGTAMIFASLLANRWDAALRIVTRQKADESNFRQVIEANGIEWNRNVEFVYTDRDPDSAEIDAGDKDFFITTSWWTTWSTMQAIAEEKIIYLLQEDERMFYPLGDDHLRCSEVLANEKIQFVVNSKLLYDHLVVSGLGNIAGNGYWFEPSFPMALFYPDDERKHDKNNFLFYARPNNLRNLYYRGLEAIGCAVNRGILNPNTWEIFFVGKDLKEMSFGRDFQPRMLQNLAWSEYAALLRRMDVGLSLMYTPHSSYPPLDLAACGAVVVTNRYGLKQRLENYSKNILCTDTNVESLVQGIADAVKLATNRPRRMENYRNNSILGDWVRSFDNVLEKLMLE
jgi:hypothetical protein